MLINFLAFQGGRLFQGGWLIESIRYYLLDFEIVDFIKSLLIDFISC